MRIPTILPFMRFKVKEKKIDKELKKTFKQKTIELYTAADQNLVDSIQGWKKGSASRKDWYLHDLKELISLDAKLPKTENALDNIDRIILAASYAMERESHEFREQIFYSREVIRKLLKDYGKEFFEQTPAEIVEWFETNPFQTISEKDKKAGFLFASLH